MKGLGILVSACLFTLLFATPLRADTTPTLPTLTLSATIVKVGDEITVSGTDFNKSTDIVERHLALYLSREEASREDVIGVDVTHYALVPGDIILDTDGDFSSFSMTIPASLEYVDTATVETTTSGTYYLYACYYTTSLPPKILPAIAAVASLTVNAGKISLAAARGTVGSPLQVSGASFLPSQPISIKFDSTTLTIEQSDNLTTAAGSFEVTVSVPPTTAGAHTITASISGFETSSRFNVDPDIEITPQSGLPDTVVIVSGNGFGKDKHLALSLKNVQVAASTTNILGSFLAFFSVPADLAAGQYNIQALDTDGNLATSGFTVLAPPTPTPTPTLSPTPSPTPTPPPPPTANINPASGYIGSDIAVTGNNFKPGGAITIKYDNTIIATSAADSKGSFTAVFKAPPSEHGQHSISISDGVNSQTLIFAIESVTPEAPALVTPIHHATVKTVTFDWNDVTDKNAPITYSLQVSSDKGFDSLVIDEKGLTASAYTPTEGERERLIPGTTYYWRVKAVDAASNESPWSAALDFTAGGFFLPLWGVFGIIGAGGILLFIIGMWIGRRSVAH